MARQQIAPEVQDLYKSRVLALIVSVFELGAAALAEDNRIWSEWLKLKSQEGRELGALVKSGTVRDSLKARAIVILRAPHSDLIPFAWPRSDLTTGDSLNFDGFKVKDLPVRMLWFTSQLLQINLLTVFSVEGDRDLQDTLRFYSGEIRKMLQVLPQDDPEAQKLFDQYIGSDSEAFRDMSSSGRYDDFGSLLLSAAIPEKWKRAADERMRAVIMAEASGQKILPEGSRPALSCYTDRIEVALIGHKVLPYSIELLASQIEFLLSVPGIGEPGSSFAHHRLLQILPLLAGDGYGELRHRLVRHVVLVDRGGYGDDPRFTVYSQETRAVAEAALAEFGADDAELRTRLEQIIEDGKQRIAEEEARDNAQRSQEEAVLEQMR